MAYLKFGIVLIVILSLICGTNYYLARCIYHCTREFFPKLRLVYVIILLALLTVMMFLSVARPLQAVPQRVISTIGALWMGLFVYLLLYFLAADLVYLLLMLIPASTQKLLFFTRLTAIVLALVTVTGGYIHANRIRTAEYDVKITDNTTSQMHIVMLSDLHIGAVGSEARLERTVARINELNPDLVCISGDIFDNNYSAIIDPDNVVQTLKRISARYGVYACLGNHDAGSEFEKMVLLLERANVDLLMDEHVVIDGRVVLAGRLDSSPIGSYKGISRQELSAVLDGVNPELPVIMLDHNPASLGEYNGEVDLVLSGHTHKGQIFPGGLITNAMYTVDYGYYQSDNGTQMIVTSGASTWGLPIRVGTDCEIVSINLGV